jgi:hypothetical protein
MSAQQAVLLRLCCGVTFACMQQHLCCSSVMLRNISDSIAP